MRKIVCFLIFFAVIPYLLIGVDVDRGLTSNVLEIENSSVIGSAKQYSGTSKNIESSKSQINFTRDEWELVDSLSFDNYLAASDNFAVEYNGMNNTIKLLDDNLTDLANQALDYAPGWMQGRLATTFMNLSTDLQDYWADVILQATHPYVDEIAFSIAYSSAAYLTSDYATPQLFQENAWLIYEHDLDLSYVEVLDYGTPESDEDYYSTTRYWKSNAEGEMYQVEVPKDIYYMYLVHPKITDEIPAYIDEEVIENNVSHNNNIVSPENGEFWRDFLYNYNDPGYPKLKYYLQQCDRVWNGTDISMNTAIGALTSWLGESMVFTSNTERPHQPVRIYSKHIGRCGEHADMRGAIARLALIPCTSILTISGDHTWNEFWDEDWTHWDGNDVNYPLLYENGWGKQYGTVFEIRSDGLITSVTDRYSEGTALITVYVLDLDGNPVDGARIVQGVYYDNTIKSDFVGFTDNEGKYTFEVGEGRQYYAQMTSAIGDVPGYLTTVEETEDGLEYEFELTAPGYMPEIAVTEIDIPVDDEDDYKLVIDFEVPKQTLNGNIVFNDLDNEKFYEPIADGDVNFFIMDLINYYAAIQDAPFEAFNCQYNMQSGGSEFDIIPPAQGSWYAVINNDSHVGNSQYIKGYAALYAYDNAGGVGTIIGTVWDDSNNEAIEGATIKAGVFETTTLADGTFSLDVFPNTYNVTCEADDYYLGFNSSVIINQDATATCDFNVMETACSVTNLAIEINEEEESVLSWDVPAALQDNSSENRELTGYDVYLGSGDDVMGFANWDLMAEGISTTEFVDQSWPYYTPGIYRYAVIAQYSSDNSSVPKFTEPVACNMTTDVSIEITTNSGDPVIGAVIILTNQESSNTMYQYYAVIEEGNSVQIENFYKGIYQLEVTLPNFVNYQQSDIEILDPVNLEVELEEKISVPFDLSVIDYLFTWDLSYEERDLQNFQIYYDGEPMGVDIEQEYVLPNTDGIHTAAVKAIFTTGESDMISIQYEDGNSMGTNLQLYIPFEDNLQDLSNNNYQSTVIGELTYETGASGNCAIFDEVGEYAIIDSVFPESEESFSVSWWLNPDTHFNWNQQLRSPQGWNGFNFHSSTTGTIYVGTDVATRFTPNTLIDGLYQDEWNFFTYTFNQGYARFFRNGYLIGEKDGVTIPAAWNGFHLGTENQNTLEGGIDELRIWNREIASNEIGLLYSQCIDNWNQVEVTALDQSGDPIENLNISIGMFKGMTDESGNSTIAVPQNSTNIVKYWVDGYDVEQETGFYSDDSGSMTLSLIYSFTASEDDDIPQIEAGITGVYPNPFNPVTAGRGPISTISFNVINGMQVTELAVYNLKGQIVKSLLNDLIEEGDYTIDWAGLDKNNRSVSSGLYFIRMKNGDTESAAKIILIK